jgi:hypothetical protein
MKVNPHGQLSVMSVTMLRVRRSDIRARNTRHMQRTRGFLCPTSDERVGVLFFLRRGRSAIWPSFYCSRESCETRAKEILIRAASTDDLEAKGMMRVIAAGYEKLARRAEQRVREADMA